MRRAWWGLGLLALAGCNDTGPPVDIIAPRGFTGPVWIVLDAGGSDIPLVNGRHQVVIPADGVLRVRSFGPFQRWHESSARDADGTTLPETAADHPVGANAVALRGGGTTVAQHGGREVCYMPYFVGTAKQFGERPPDDYPPGF